MENYDWPGNVRELENIVERTINLTEADVINDKDLPDELQNSVCSALAVHDGRTKNYNLKDSEKMIIERCLMEKKVICDRLLSHLIFHVEHFTIN